MTTQPDPSDDELDAILHKIRYNEYYSEAMKRLPLETQQFVETTSWAGELHEIEKQKLAKAALQAYVQQEVLLGRVEELTIMLDENKYMTGEAAKTFGHYWSRRMAALKAKGATHE